jgi:hypothetical protein
MSRTIALAALLLAAACASTSTPHYATVLLKDYTEKDGYVAGVLDLNDPNVVLLCGMETPTGTHVAKRICRSEAQLALIHQHTQDWLREVRSGVNTGNAVSSNGRAFVAP